VGTGLTVQLHVEQGSTAGSRSSSRPRRRSLDLGRLASNHLGVGHLPQHATQLQLAPVPKQVSMVGHYNQSTRLVVEITVRVSDGNGVVVDVTY
jgi:hypothetical protein